jgi:UDP-GlcNAc:undecaprenyl-phosphate/decaprenyl-phosphate GlcNAc-1-phosphate transferase
MKQLIYLYLFILAFIFSLVFVPIARRLAIRFRIVDTPHERKIHNEEKPLMGGFAIYLAFIITLTNQLVGFFLMKNSSFFVNMFPLLARQTDLLLGKLPQLLVILGGATIMLILGFIDDRRGMGFSYKLKFVVQFLVAGLLVTAGVRTDFMPTDFLNSVVTILWVIGVTNAFNLLDNMDGLAAGVAFIAVSIFFVLTAMQGQLFSAMIYCVIAGSLIGFLRYNFPPAKIFMGDAGSLFIGFIVASLAVTSSYVFPESPSLLPVLIPVVVLGIPIFDTLSVIYIRIREGRHVFAGDRRHLSHRLVDRGMTQKGAVIFIYIVSGGVGAAALLLPYLSLLGGILIILLIVLTFVGIFYYSTKLIPQDN